MYNVSRKDGMGLYVRKKELICI